MTKATALARWRRLKKVVEAIPARQFNMGDWGKYVGVARPSAHGGCGTVACALGHASLDPVLRRQGLRGKWTPATGCPGTKVYFLWIHFRSYSNLWAAVHFFDLHITEAVEVFLACDANKRQVLRKIDTIMKAKEAR